MDPIFPQDIEALCQVKSRLEPIMNQVLENKKDLEEYVLGLGDEPTDLKTSIIDITKKWEDLIRINESIKTYLEKHCQHKFIDDYIDTAPDCGMNIRYCMYCYCQ